MSSSIQKRKDKQFWLFQQPVDQVLQGRSFGPSDFESFVATDWAVVLFFERKRMSIDAVRAVVQHIIVEVRSRRGRNLEGFVAARGGNDCICAGDGLANLITESKLMQTDKPGIMFLTTP